jgi:N-acyl homoserine lactone hydrolase
MRVYLLNGGTLEADRALIHPGDDSHQRVTLPIPQILIQHGGQNILIDTGIPLCAVDEPRGLEREFGIDPAWISPRVAPEQRVDRQLASLGVALADLTMTICTHFHFDHAGGNALFAGIQPIVAQEAEVRAAHEGNGYMPVWDAPGLQFEIVHGDWSPLPGVELLHTPGHTPGHQSVLVRLQPETWLFTVDVVYTEEHWRRDSLGAVTDIPAARASLERLRQVAADEHAKLVFGHDIGQWGAFGMSPAGGPRLVASDE